MNVGKLLFNVKGRKVCLGIANHDDHLKCSYLRFEVLEKYIKLRNYCGNKTRHRGYGMWVL
jgi:hypothetical protein